jgi:very-short-patch-repair endonuclease
MDEATERPPATAGLDTCLSTPPIPGYVYDLCRRLRENGTPAERILWEAIRDRRLAGFKFRRQHPVGRFIADFYCAQARLVVELDGSGHGETGQRAYDGKRSEFLAASGRTVIRISNASILENLESVLSSDLHHARARSCVEISSCAPSLKIHPVSTAVERGQGVRLLRSTVPELGN